MLLLSFDLALDESRSPLPEHLGGLLHCVLDDCLRGAQPAAYQALRHGGAEGIPHYSLLAPPFGQSIERHLRFGITLFAQARPHWLELLISLVARFNQGFAGRRAQVLTVALAQPTQTSCLIYSAGKGFDGTTAPASAVWPTPDTDLSTIMPLHHYSLHFASPVLVASKTAQMAFRNTQQALPWPTLGNLLRSLAKRACALEPMLAQALKLEADWQPQTAADALTPLTAPTAPAQQVEWAYQSSNHPPLPVPGITGTLIYPCAATVTEHELLHWGQWLAVGGKTAWGHGSYSLKVT